MTSGTNLTKEQKVAGLYQHMRTESEHLAAAQKRYKDETRKVTTKMKEHGISLDELTAYTLTQEPSPSEPQ